MTKEKIKKLVDQYDQLVGHCENRCDAISKAYREDRKYITNGDHHFDEKGFFTEYVNTYDYQTREGTGSLTWEQITMSNEEFEKVLVEIREKVEKKAQEKLKMTEDAKLAVKVVQYQKLKKELEEIGKI